MKQSAWPVFESQELNALCIFRNNGFLTPVNPGVRKPRQKAGRLDIIAMSYRSACISVRDLQVVGRICVLLYL